MYVTGIVGPSDSGKTTLVERLTERLSERGRVATVKHLHDPDIDTEGKDTARHRAAGAGATYGLTDDGTWFATGADRTLRETLDDLAPAYDYALVEGYSGATVDQIVLAGREHAGEAIYTAENADAVDLGAAVDAIEATEPYVTLESLVEEVTARPEAEYGGAVATFTGRVRAKDDPEDDPTEHLAFEKYEGVADDRMADLTAEFEAREDVLAVTMHHRTGVVEAGEDIVFVVVLAGHREAAFETVSDGIDRLKDEVPIFKKEVTVEDAYWVHER